MRFTNLKSWLNERWVFLVFGVFASLFAFVFVNIVWIRDISDSAVDVIARVESPTGEVFRLVQEWNRGDLYDVYVIHEDLTGEKTVYKVDPDYPKFWPVFGRMKMDSNGVTFRDLRFSDFECRVEWSGDEVVVHDSLNYDDFGYYPRLAY